MKKITAMIMLAAFALGCGSLFAQEFYAGGAMPEGYTYQAQTPKVPITDFGNGETYTGTMQPEHFTPPDYGTYSANRNGIICNPCAASEGEADIPNEGSDVTNGGCNFTPFLTLPIQLGDVICGRGNGYMVGTASFRDTDWYEFTLTESKTVYFSGYANFNALFYIVSLPCPGSAIATAIPAPGTVGTATATIGPGTFICFVAPSSFGSNPLLDGDYMVTLTETLPGDPETWCYTYACLGCADAEGEPPNVNNIGDITNYGCNGVEFEPDRPPIFSPISIGDVICGTGDHYTIGTVGYRDTDWYRLVLTEKRKLYWSGVADFSISLIILGGPCNAQLSYGFTTPETGSVGTLSAILYPGEYYFWVAPSDWNVENNGNYMVTLTEYDPGYPGNWCNPPLVPVSNWALYLGIGLILVFALFRFRRMI